MALELDWDSYCDRDDAAHGSVANLGSSWGWWVKQFLCGRMGPTDGAWAVAQSCDSTQVKTDGTDLLVTYANVVRSTSGVRSWAVLVSPSALGPIYWTMVANGTSDRAMWNWYASKIAPTGGTTSAHPTAADQTEFPANTYLNDNTASASRFHGGLSSRGDFVVMASKNGQGSPHLVMFFAKSIDPLDCDLWPYIGFLKYVHAPVINAGPLYVDNLMDSANWISRDAGTGRHACTGIVPTEPYLNSGTWMDMWSGYADRANSQWPDRPMEMVNTVGSDNGYEGEKGRLPDIRWAPSILATNQKTADDTIVVDHCYLPIQGPMTL